MRLPLLFVISIGITALAHPCPPCPPFLENTQCLHEYILQLILVLTLEWFLICLVCLPVIFSEDRIGHPTLDILGSCLSVSHCSRIVISRRCSLLRGHHSL